MFGSNNNKENTSNASVDQDKDSCRPSMPNTEKGFEMCPSTVKTGKEQSLSSEQQPKTNPEVKPRTGMQDQTKSTETVDASNTERADLSENKTHASIKEDLLEGAAVVRSLTSPKASQIETSVSKEPNGESGLTLGTSEAPQSQKTEEMSQHGDPESPELRLEPKQELSPDEQPEINTNIEPNTGIQDKPDDTENSDTSNTERTDNQQLISDNASTVENSSETDLSQKETLSSIHKDSTVPKSPKAPDNGISHTSHTEKKLDDVESELNSGKAQDPQSQNTEKMDRNSSPASPKAVVETNQSLSSDEQSNINTGAESNTDIQGKPEDTETVDDPHTDTKGNPELNTSAHNQNGVLKNEQTSVSTDQEQALEQAQDQALDQALEQVLEQVQKQGPGQEHAMQENKPNPNTPEGEVLS